MTDAAHTNRLKELREAADLSRPAVADLLGIGEHQVRRWESGETQIPTKHLVSLADRLGVTTDHLLGRDTVARAAA